MRIFSRVLVISILFISTPILAKETNKNKFITFQTFSVKKAPNNNARLLKPPASIIEERLDNINTEKLKSFTETIRDSICKAVKNGTIKVWISVGSKAAVLAVSAHANAGMEITMNCNKTNNI